MVALSVLVPSVHTRFDGPARHIQQQLFTQRAKLDNPEQVEIIVLTDTMNVTIGEKRNQLLNLAHGDYVVFVDDDDRLEPDYLQTILTATETGRDVITFRVSVTLNGDAPKTCRYSIRYPQDRNTPTEYHRLPNHICAVRREHATATRFPEQQFGEDSDYAKRLRRRLRTEHTIDRVLYHYDFDSETTETQKPPRTGAPVVDVVILSKATTPELRQMTQNTIDTCVSGAHPHTVNIIVVEQTTATYKRATVTRNPGVFCYNASANQGATAGTAPWIMIANNDLEFEAGWLTPLLKANHPVMSPLNPGDRRQRTIRRNTVGTSNGTHFSGWCFMLTRDLWERIGHFDQDTVRFWASDDVVIEQVTAAGVKPMIVPASRVRHLVSKTLRTTPDDDLTWGDLHRFNEKYGRDKFSQDPRFQAWKRKHLTSQH